MTTRSRRYIGRANRRRAQRAPLRSRRVAMTYAIDQGGPVLDRMKNAFAPLFRHIVELIEAEEAGARRPLIHNGRKPR